VALKDIVGNEGAIKLLKMACAKGKVAHAYAFCGPSHIGKRTTAVQFAKALNCLNQVADSEGVDSCDACQSCKHIDSGTSLDVQIIAPTAHQDEEEVRALSIRVDNMRRMRSDAMLSARHSRFKVYIIDDAELATEEAANCILKTLEEPAHNVVIILITANQMALPRTVISRCQVVRFGLVPTHKITEALMSRLGMESHTATLCAMLSKGRPGLAFAFAKSESVKDTMDEARKLLEHIVTAEPIEAIKLSERIIALGASLSKIFPSSSADAVEPERKHALRGIDTLLGCIRDYLAMLCGMQAEQTVTHLSGDATKQRTVRYEPQRLVRLTEALTRARHALLLNANVQLTLEVSLLQYICTSGGS
jgi:DNA polymerase-3 subunit delta'